MFIVSKLLNGVTQPLYWVLVVWIVGLLSIRRWRRFAFSAMWGGVLLVFMLGFLAPPNALLRALEARYSVPDSVDLDRYAGLIVLGGAVGNPDSFAAHAQVPLSEAAARLTVPLELMRQHPAMGLIFSGGDGNLLPRGASEAIMTQAFFQSQGMDLRRVQFEAHSRTTRENAQQVARLLGTRCAQPWLLVTSAWHMPRAMVEFEAVGCKVTAYPVDFRTGLATPVTDYDLANSLRQWQTALHEWLGLWVYWVTR
jgi:uncharacterized SAM-binding protein YcdF (DUF218 family)